MEESRNEAAEARSAGMRAGVARTLAQSFCLVGGIALIAAGILGFFFGGSDFTTGANVAGEEFIVFEVNGWHNVVHIATGAFLVVMGVKAASAAIGALVFGALYVVVTVWGFVTGDDILGLVPVNDADNWLHLALALAGIVIGVAAGALGASARRNTAGRTT